MKDKEKKEILKCERFSELEVLNVEKITDNYAFSVSETWSSLRKLAVRSVNFFFFFLIFNYFFSNF